MAWAQEEYGSVCRLRTDRDTIRLTISHTQAGWTPQYAMRQHTQGRQTRGLRGNKRYFSNMDMT